MAYIRGEGRSQGTLFPVMLDDLIPADPMYRATLPSSAPIDFSFNCPLFTLFCITSNTMTERQRA